MYIHVQSLGAHNFFSGISISHRTTIRVDGNYAWTPADLTVVYFILTACLLTIALKKCLKSKTKINRDIETA